MSINELLRSLLGDRIPPGSHGDVSIKCFHHEDEHNSCSLNLDTGLWVCHSSGQGGNLLTAVKHIKGCSSAEAKKFIAEAGIDMGKAQPKTKADEPDKIIDESISKVYQKNLAHNPEARSTAITDFGWSDEAMREFEIGWDEKTQRYVYPIRNEMGQLVNFRLYDPKASGENKVISWKRGHGQVRLWPFTSLDADTLVLCEGEKDCVIMNQVLRDNRVEGWAAITGTGGAGTWKSAWNERFAEKDVIIIYDRDPAGIEAAQKVATELIDHATRVKVITLDIIQPKNADVTDYFVVGGKGWDDLKRLIDETDYFTPQTKVHKPVGVKDETLYKPHLAEASEDRYLYKRLELKVMVAGKDLAPYAVPRTMTFDCYMDQGNMCNGCSNANNNGLQVVDIHDDDPDIIKLVKVPEDVQQNVIRRKRGINTRCRAVEVTSDDYHNVEEVTLIPELDFSSQLEREHVSRTAYVMEHGIMANKSYVMRGTSVPHPKSQHVVHFVEQVDPAQDSIDGFELDDVKIDRLKKFQVNKPGIEGVRAKFEEIAHDLTINVTRIYGREDLIVSADLCYHSVIAFDFMDKPVAKAWGDIIILGDTRTGKSETIAALVKHYRLGSMSVAENTSFAGLIGGLRQEAGGRWSIMWGSIPLNDRRLLVIDEASGLSVDSIGAMSGIRSNGIAEMIKIAGIQRTMARTRLIWITNPRNPRAMSEYSHGVEVIREVIGRPEDIARFDFAISAATNEVSIDLINAFTHEHVPHEYTSDMCRLLILWAWSRKSENIVFTEPAVKKVLELATEQSSRYASEGGIPLVEGGNHRIKLAKLAVAAAIRVFSTEDGVNVIVKPEHVEFVAGHLDQLYEKRSLDYSGFSQAVLARSHVPDSAILDAEEWVKQNPEWAELWLLYPALRVDDFKNQFDLEVKEVKSEIIRPLSKLRMIEKSRESAFRKTPVFIDVLKRMREVGHISFGQANGSAPAAAPVAAAVADDDDIPF